MSQSTEPQMQQQQQQPIMSQNKPKKGVYIPKIFYNLQKKTQRETLTDIASLTGGFIDLPMDVAQWIQYDIRSRNFTSFGTLKSPENEEVVKKIIGVDGYYLKLTTSNKGVDFIWHDRENKEFQFWGKYQSCVNAMNEIRYRIAKVEQDVKDDGIVNTVQKTKTKPVVEFENDKHPIGAVCLEVVLDKDGNVLGRKSYKAEEQQYHSQLIQRQQSVMPKEELGCEDESEDESDNDYERGCDSCRED